MKGFIKALTSAELVVVPMWDDGAATILTLGVP